ncbi:PorT family protein [Polaribacter litorisediminis]|uniref:porin family protein n=1 Tax=Polaribacter litorisediminis TaxID=1908341 RepID=UPI001CBD08F6|nr:porin family protein [Polaribacter litorisediminis]UAM98276.1 PorT family protein [Polaribacter litorisediminis]
MMKIFCFNCLLFFVLNVCAQKDSLQLGDWYAEDQIYGSISYAQFSNQPKEISKSGFSYALSMGFIKDIILNKKGTISIALGIGYGFDFFNHKLRVEEINNVTVFNPAINLTSNVFKAHNLEFPIELRFRTSNAKKYEFWRFYGGLKFLYNLSNKFQFEENSMNFEYKNVSAYQKLQYGLSLSAGYDEVNLNLFYNLTPMFTNAKINGETIDTSILKFGLIFYLL